MGAALAGAALSLSGCSSGSSMSDYLFGDKPSGSVAASGISADGAIAPDLAVADDAKPIAELYNKGLASLHKGEYRSAAKEFGEVERQHPYSSWATRAILMQAYAQYMRNDYTEALNASKRFITLHPGHKDAAYAYYLIALSHYERISDTRRDATAAKQALESLDEVSQRFPGSPYARDAAAKANLARDQLAGKEMEVGRYYMRQKAYLAAINRYKTVVQTYQTTSHTPEALYRLTETYMALGVRSEAQTAAAVLGHNYPGTQWYKDAYSLLQTGGLQPEANPGSWISQALGL